MAKELLLLTTTNFEKLDFVFMIVFLVMRLSCFFSCFKCSSYIHTHKNKWKKTKWSGSMQDIMCVVHVGVKLLLI
jgi:hypothetical protein